MTLRDTWNSVVSEFRSSKLNKWQSDTINTTNTSKCDMTILLNTWFPPILRRLSGVFLHNIPKDCGRDIKSTFDRQGNITLNQIIDILINYDCQPIVANGGLAYGYTHSRTDFNESMQHIYVFV
tara:strand:+ start:156 stop:527 length:372 start_codon:yes stop_codon:yes gene_type:complete